jgi:hypothetical protein
MSNLGGSESISWKPQKKVGSEFGPAPFFQIKKRKLTDQVLEASTYRKPNSRGSDVKLMAKSIEG